MATFGSIEQFDPQQGTFSEYQERVEFYFTANGITDEERKRAIFLTVVGPSQFRSLKDLCAPSPISDKTYDELCTRLRQHHEPKPQKYVQRTKFENRFRHPSESISQFVASLRHLSEHCEFGESIEERLCERLVRGVNDEKIQRRLLSEADLTLQKAIDIAQAMVLSETGAKGLHHGLSQHSGLEPNVNLVRHHHRKPAATASSKCMRCGSDHRGKECKFLKAKCYNCGKEGHISKVCRSKAKPNSASANNNSQPQKNNRVSKDKPRYKQKHFSCHSLDKEEQNSDSDNMYGLFTAQPDAKKAIWIEMIVQNKPLSFQLDTGASASVITRTVFNDMFPSMELTPSSAKLRTYTGDDVKVLGQFQPVVEYQNQKKILPLLVVESSGPSLLGRNWLNDIKLDWHNLFHISEESLRSVISKFDGVFNTEAGLLKDHTQRIHLKENATPIFKKARHPPYALRDKIEAELSRLEEGGIIEKVTFSDWATPIVPILKSDSTIRICGDYKVTVNKMIAKEEHPIPQIEELANKLAKGKKFSTIDFSHAYTHIALDPDSQDITTINSHCGLYRYKRLPYGISSCAAIFQRTMEAIFKDIPNTVIYFDNLYITGFDDANHLKTLETVLERCEKRGLNIKRSKCEFLKDEIDFLGYRLTKDGLLPQPKKIAAIMKAPRPNNVHELKSYLGMLNYYSKFLPNLSNQLAPLYDLLKKDMKWIWTRKQQSAFEHSK